MHTNARLTQRPFLYAALQGSAPQRVEQPPQPAALLGALVAAPGTAPHVPPGSPLGAVRPEARVAPMKDEEKTRGDEQGGASQGPAPPPASSSLPPPRPTAPVPQRIGRTVPHPARENPFHSWGVPGTVDVALKRAFGADFVPSNHDTVTLPALSPFRLARLVRGFSFTVCSGNSAC